MAEGAEGRGEGWLLPELLRDTFREKLVGPGSGLSGELIRDALNRVDWDRLAEIYRNQANEE